MEGESAKRKREEFEDGAGEGGAKKSAAPAAEPHGFLRLKHDDWRQALAGETRAPYFSQLVNFVEQRRRHAKVFPPPSCVFAALDASPFRDVRCVIIGQDPYHGECQANGLAFSIADTSKCKFPPSLRNIFEELMADPAIDFRRKPTYKPGTNGSLEAWARQGVLLLNAVLTVEEGKANSHQKKAGWERFTDAVVRAVLKREGKGSVFMLWGLPAAKKVPSIDTAKHRVIMTSHPSPLSNTKGDKPFSGSRCFSRCNELLAEIGHEPIDWNIE